MSGATKKVEIRATGSIEDWLDTVIEPGYSSVPRMTTKQFDEELERTLRSNEAARR